MTSSEDRFITRAAEKRAINLDTGVHWELFTPRLVNLSTSGKSSIQPAADSLSQAH